MWHTCTRVSDKPVAFIFIVEDGGSKFPRKVGTYLPNYMAIHLRDRNLNIHSRENLKANNFTTVDDSEPS
jgi:hypothetical protein